MLIWVIYFQYCNTYAPLSMAHLRHQETSRDKKRRKLWKVSLAKSLDEKGFTGDDREALYCFIDWLLVLPENLELEYHEEMKRYEEEKKMAYVTTAERIGIKKGLEEQKRVDARAMVEEGIERPKIMRVLKITEEELDAILGEAEKT